MGTAPVARADLAGEGVPATGPNDRYTRLSRAVVLLPEADNRVRWLRFAVGKALIEDAHSADPMASFRAGSNGLVRLTFTEGRDFWRDLSALLPDAQGVASRPAAVLAWAASIAPDSGTVWQTIVAAGLASKEAKLLRWRLESLIIPATFLEDPENARDLRDALMDLEELYGRLRTLAERRLAESLPKIKENERRKYARAILKSSGFTAVFFAEAERKLHDFLRLLANADIDAAWTGWQAAQLSAVRKAWQVVGQLAGQSPVALQAEARCHAGYLSLLKPLRPQSSLPSEVYA